MIQRRSRQQSGFTLVELLVVMGIIAILAGVLFAAGGAALRAAERAKAAQIANALQTSVLNYYTEYNVYPLPANTPTTGDYMISDGDTANWPILVDALCGNINPYNSSSVTPTTIANARNITFLNLKAGDLISATDPAPKNPLPAIPANNSFNLVMDANYDNIVGDGTIGGSSSSTAGTPMPDFVNSSIGNIKAIAGNAGTSGGVAVWADCNTSTKEENPGFFIRTF